MIQRGDITNFSCSENSCTEQIDINTLCLHLGLMTMIQRGDVTNFSCSENSCTEQIDINTLFLHLGLVTMTDVSTRRCYDFYMQ